MVCYNSSLTRYQGNIMSKKRYFWICIITFIFIFSGFSVSIYHHHSCEDLCDVGTHQIYCHYVRSPISKVSIPDTIPIVLFITVIYLPLFLERKIVCLVDSDCFQKYYLAFLSTFSYRSPPLR